MQRGTFIPFPRNEYYRCSCAAPHALFFRKRAFGAYKITWFTALELCDTTRGKSSPASFFLSLSLALDLYLFLVMGFSGKDESYCFLICSVRYLPRDGRRSSVLSAPQICDSRNSVTPGDLSFRDKRFVKTELFLSKGWVTRSVWFIGTNFMRGTIVKIPSFFIYCCLFQRSSPEP